MILSTSVLSKKQAVPPFDEKEILRYAGCRDDLEDMRGLLDECVAVCADRLSYKACWRILPVNLNGSICNFGAFSVCSENLAHNLSGCRSAILLAATVGVELDRLIARYSVISPSKAVIFQAIGAERIEALCNAFCRDVELDMAVNLKPRFSPGYGDLPLEVQKKIFEVLDCSNKIGLYLNDSLLMSPSKSVTAFVGIQEPDELPEV